MKHSTQVYLEEQKARWFLNNLTEQLNIPPERLAGSWVEVDATLPAGLNPDPECFSTWYLCRHNGTEWVLEERSYRYSHTREKEAGNEPIHAGVLLLVANAARHLARCDENVLLEELTRLADVFESDDETSEA